MGVAIHLLGTPHVEHDGVPAEAPKGRKVWGLLAYLLLSEATPTRTQLAALLFPDAEDPLRALRWNLTALRRLLGPDVPVDGEQVSLRLPPGTFVDAQVLPRGTWIEAVAVPSMEDELLAGMDFSTAVTFETWLLNERRHLRAAAAAALSEGTLARLGVGDAEGAVRLADRLVRLEPLDDSHQALLVRSLTAAGDHAAAQQQIESCRQLFRRELGVEPSAALTQAQAVPAYPRPTSRGLATVRAQMDAGRAAIGAGAVDVGLAYLQQAAAESHALGDRVLQTEALLAVGSELVHAGRGRQLEGAEALHRVVVLAEEEGDAEMAATAHHHLAWIDLMAARYGPMHRKLDEAERLAPRHAGVQIWAGFTRGLGHLATAHYRESQVALADATAAAHAVGDVGLEGLGLALLAGTFVHRGDFDAAKAAAQEASEHARSGRRLSQLALAQARLGEAEQHGGNADVAYRHLEEAAALADQVLDACVQATAGTALGLLEFRRGDLASAMPRLAAAWSRPMMLPDNVWKGALALDAMCSVAVRQQLPNAGKLVSDLEAIAGRTGMRELLARAYLHRHRLGEPTAAVATMLASEIDSPVLHELVMEETGAGAFPLVAAGGPVQG